MPQPTESGGASADPAQLRLQARLEGKPVVIPRDLQRRKRKREDAEIREARRADSEAHARRRLEHKTAVPLQLADPHPLIELTRMTFSKASTDADGILITRAKRRLPISVSPEQLNRALLIMDTVLKAIAAAGLHPEVAKKGGPRAFVDVEGESIEFSLSEVIDRRPHAPTAEERRKKKEDEFFYDWPKWDYFLSGKLRLSIDNVSGGPKKSWTDGKRWIVEDCIDAFIRALWKSAQRVKDLRVIDEQRRREREEWHREYELKQKQRADRAARVAEERNRVQRLDRELARMQKAEDIRRYADQLERTFTPDGTELLPWHGKGWWIRWCRAYAEILDPTSPETGTPAEAEDGSGGFGIYSDPWRVDLATDHMADAVECRELELAD